MDTTEVIWSDKVNDERIIKLHLFDDSINIHGWGIDKELAASLAADYVGTPYIIPPDFNHPVRPYSPLEDPQADIEDIQRYAKPFEAGTCFKTDKCGFSHSANGFDGYIKLTDKKAIEAFDLGLIPRYASISMYNLDSKDKGHIRKGKALNICAVAKPAYANAKLLGRCRGDSDGCSTNLKNAGVSTEVHISSDFCFLKTLEANTYDKYKQEASNTSLNRETELLASYNTMSANNQVSPSQSQPLPQQQQQQPQPQIQQPPQQIPTTPGQSLQQQLQPQIQQQDKTPEQQQLDAINNEIDEIAQTKLDLESMRGQFAQKDALVADYQKQIEAFKKQEEALKLREIERFVTIETFNGDSKLHKGKVEDWKMRAANMPIDDLVFYLQESYGRRTIPKDKEKKAGLAYEPTAVLAGDKQVTQKYYSIYDSVGGSF